MKALVFTGPSQLEVQDLERPTAGPEEVVVRLDAVGICGSDVHGYAGETGRRTPGMVMGHEAAGIIVECAADVADWEPGTRVTFNPVLSCRDCRACAAGDRQLCAKRAVIGVHTGRRGAFAEYINVPAINLRRIRDELDLELGALVEPLAVGLHAVGQAGVRPGDSVAVVGAGMIGLMVLLGALRAGAETVFVSDLDEAKLEVAERLGARVVDAKRTRLESVVGHHADGGGVDRVIDAVGATATLREAITIARRGGTVCLVGMAVPDLSLDSYAVSTGERVIVGSFCYSDQHFDDAVAMVNDNEIPADMIIEQRIGLDDAPVTFAALASGRATTIKTLVQPVPAA